MEGQMAAPETKPKEEATTTTTTTAAPAERPTSDPKDEPRDEIVAATSEGDFEPIEPDDDDANPVLVRVPKNDEEITAEGNALAAAGSEVAGGNLPNAFEPVQFVNERVWAMDADHNTNARQGRHAWDTKPDYVETNRA